MKLNQSAANFFLRRPEPNVFVALVYGTDSGKVSEFVCKLRSKWLDHRADDFSISGFTAGEISKNEIGLVDEMAAYSLTGGPRLVHIKNPNADDTKHIIETLKVFSDPDNLPVARLLIEAGPLPTSNLLRKALEKDRDKAVVIACYPDRPGDVMRVCKQLLLEAGHTIEPDALSLLASSLPPDRKILSLEVEKLICFLNDRPKQPVTIAHIQDVISEAGNSTLEKLVFACVEGRAADADKALNQLIDSGQSAIMIVRAVARHLHRMHQVLCATKNGGSIASAMSALRPPIFAMHRDIFMRHCSIWSATKLEKALEKATIAEQELKSPLGTEPYLAGRFVLAISTLRH